VLEKATRRFVQREIPQARSVEPAAPHLTAETRLARATFRRGLFAQRA